MKVVIYRLIALMLLISGYFSFGQAANSTCNTKGNPERQALYYANSGNFTSNSHYCLKIYIHVLRDSQGNGGQSITEILQAIEILREDFSNHQIYFNYGDEDFDEIKNTLWYNDASLFLNDILSWNNNSDGIDIYMLNDDNVSEGGLAVGTGVVVSGSFWATPTGGSVTISSILSHEVGHVLGLEHTHHGCESGLWENELDSEGNPYDCTNSGDYVCDTPEDFNLGFNVNGYNCSWSNTNWESGDCPILPSSFSVGDFNPDLTNIMSYTHIDCMEDFTEGQGERMRNMISIDQDLQALMSDCPIGICPQNLTILQDVTDPTSQDIQEAEISVLAKNTIENGTTAAYDAGESVTLGTRFHAKAGSDFRAYIDGCSAFTAPQKGSSKNKKQDVIEDILVYPNPAKDKVNIMHSNLNIESYVLYDIHGRTVNKQGSIKNTKYIIDVSKFGKGLYILNIILEDKTTITKQLIIN